MQAFKSFSKARTRHWFVISFSGRGEAYIYAEGWCMGWIAKNVHFMPISLFVFRRISFLSHSRVLVGVLGGDCAILHCITKNDRRVVSYCTFSKRSVYMACRAGFSQARCFAIKQIASNTETSAAVRWFINTTFWRGRTALRCPLKIADVLHPTALIPWAHCSMLHRTLFFQSAYRAMSGVAVYYTASHKLCLLHARSWIWSFYSVIRVFHFCFYIFWIWFEYDGFCMSDSGSTFIQV